MSPLADVKQVFSIALQLMQSLSLRCYKGKTFAKFQRNGSSLGWKFTRGIAAHRKEFWGLTHTGMETPECLQCQLSLPIYLPPLSCLLISFCCIFFFPKDLWNFRSINKKACVLPHIWAYNPSWVTNLKVYPCTHKCILHIAWAKASVAIFTLSPCLFVLLQCYE